MPSNESIGSKQAILDLWANLPEDGPVPLTPIEPGHTGSTFACDQLRVTGSKEWIEWILSRIKPVLEFDGNGSRLEVVFIKTCERLKDAHGKYVKDEKGNYVNGGWSGSYALYVKAKSRGAGQPVRARKPRTQKPVEVSPEATVEATKPIKSKALSPLKEVNAGLKLRDDLRKKKMVAYAPVYAIASMLSEWPPDEEGNPEPAWVEPEPNEYGTTTYEDYNSCDDAIAKLRKDKNFAKLALGVVMLERDKNGKMTYSQV